MMCGLIKLASTDAYMPTDSSQKYETRGFSVIMCQAEEVGRQLLLVVVVAERRFVRADHLYWYILRVPSRNVT